MKITPGEMEKYLAQLIETPHRITKSTRGVGGKRLQFRSNSKDWSVNDILAHLRSCADVWGGSIEAMLAKDTPKLPDIHPRQWIKQTNYSELAFDVSFNAFISQRNKMIVVLKQLSFDDWSRSAMIGGREHTVFSQVRRMAKHEQEHCEQIESLLEGAV